MEHIIGTMCSDLLTVKIAVKGAHWGEILLLIPLATFMYGLVS